MGEDDIVELLWKSGHVVPSSQAERPPAPPSVLRGSGSGGGRGEGTAPFPFPHPPPLLQQLSDGQNLFMGEDEMASWLHHHPLPPPPPPPLGEDEFPSHLFYSSLVSTPFTQPQGSLSLTPPLLPLPPPPAAERPMGQVIAERRAENFINFSRLRLNIHTGGRVEAAAAPWVPLVVQDLAQVGSSATPLTSSYATESCPTRVMMVTSGVLQTFAVPSLSSHRAVCEMPGPSSLVVSRTELAQPLQIQPAMEETEAAVAAAAAAADDDEGKRKEREEPVDDVTEETGEEARGSGSRKRSRAAEMHNISERRRREKINEKMKTLQELIPRCNKTDKASMLDDAIEYVKSLQLQIQMMSAGGMMPPMMYNPNMPPPPMGMMGMNRPPPFIPPFPGTAFPRQTQMAGLAPPYPPPPRYPFPNVQPFDPSSVHLPTQQPNPNQPQFPGYLNPYSQFVGLQQPPLPLTTQLQNQTTSQLVSFGQASSSKEPEDQGNKPTG